MSCTHASACQCVLRIFAHAGAQSSHVGGGGDGGGAGAGAGEGERARVQASTRCVMCEIFAIRSNRSKHQRRAAAVSPG